MNIKRGGKKLSLLVYVRRIKVKLRQETVKIERNPGTILSEMCSTKIVVLGKKLSECNFLTNGLFVYDDDVRGNIQAILFTNVSSFVHYIWNPYPQTEIDLIYYFIESEIFIYFTVNVMQYTLL